MNFKKVSFSFLAAFCSIALCGCESYNLNPLIKGNKKGEQGVGIASIGKTSTNENVDTYTITLTDGSTSTFDVTNAAPGYDTTYDYLDFYPLADGTYAVDIIKQAKLENLVVPETYHGIPVTELAFMDATSYYEYAKTLTIPKSIKTFSSPLSGPEMPNLEKIIYKGTIEEYLNIERASWFAGFKTDNLYKIMIDDQEVKEISLPLPETKEIYLYEFCFTTIEKITIPEGTTKITGGGNTTRNLKNINIPNSVTTLGFELFKNCTLLTDVTIPNSVTTIEESVFENCTSLTSISIPTSVTNIGDAVFKNCASLTSISIPTSVTDLGRRVFENCINLESLSISSTDVDSGIFGIYIGQGYSYNPNNLTKLKTLTFTETVKNIDGSGLRFTPNIETINLPASIENIKFYVSSTTHPSLSTINYAGTAQQWSQVQVESSSEFINTILVTK